MDLLRVLSIQLGSSPLLASGRGNKAREIQKEMSAQRFRLPHPGPGLQHLAGGRGRADQLDLASGQPGMPSGCSLMPTCPFAGVGRTPPHTCGLSCARIIPGRTSTTHFSWPNYSAHPRWSSYCLEATLSAAYSVRCSHHISANNFSLHIFLVF